MSSATHPTDTAPLQISDIRGFHVPGDYVVTDSGEMMSGGIFVEHYKPAKVLKSAPIVMVHGNWQTAANFTGTPDGRRGWAHDFLRAGYEVYLIDQPARGRSGNPADLHGVREGKTVEFVEQRFTNSAAWKLWPQAATHTQWPGTGRKGDPAFDRLYASQVESLVDRRVTEQLNLAANIRLAEQIGPAIWLTHSQSGPFGFALADACPDKVLALLSIEPNGPTFHECLMMGEADGWFRDSEEVVRPLGAGQLLMNFEPPLPAGQPLPSQRQTKADGPGLIPCHLQAEPARQLPNLGNLKLAIVVGEASYHAPYDHCTAAFLGQAGVPVDLIRLEDRGINGNGHMMMLEQNNHEIADLLLQWLDERKL